MILKRLLTIIFFCSVHAAFGQNNFDSIFSLKGDTRKAALLKALINERDSAANLLKINSLVDVKGSKADRSLYDFMATLRKSGADNSSYKAAKPVLREFLANAKHAKDHYLQAIIYFNIGEYANVHDHHNEAFENKLYALRELETDPNGKYFGEYWMVYQIASEYYLFHDYAKVLELCKPIYTPSPAPGWDTWYMKITGNLIGMSHLKNGNPDSARVWFEKTNAMAAATGDSAWQGISVGNIGNSFFKQKNYTEAITYYKNALLFCRPQKLWDNIAPFSCNLANCYMMIGNLADVPALLEDAKQAISKDEYHTFANYGKYFATAQSYYRKTGNAAAALECADSLAAYTTRESEAFNINKKLQTEAQMAYRSKELENEVDLQKVKQSRILLYGLLIVVLLLSAIAVLLFKRQQLKHRLRNEELEFERSKASEELSLSMTEIRDFTKLIEEKNDLILQFMIEIDTLKHKVSDISTEQSAQIEELRQSASLTEEDRAKFNRLFEKAYPGFTDRLKEKYPDLTPEEIKYLVFIKLELSPKEMSAMSGVDTDAIHQIHNKAEEKLHASENNTLENIVEEL